MSYLDLQGREIVSSAKRQRIKRRVEPPTCFDKSIALDLLKAINRQKRWPKQTIIAEADGIRMLRRVDRRPIEEIEAIMLFHVSMLRDQFQPRAFTGKSFRAKYFRIKLRFEQMFPPEEKVEISKEAKDIFSRIKTLDWPNVTLKQLQIEVQLSLDWLRRTRNIIAAEKSHANGSHVMLKQNSYNELLTFMTPAWVEQYYTDLSNTLQRKEWSCDIRKFRMSIEQKVVWSKIQKTLERFAGIVGTSLANHLKEILNET